MRLLLFSIMTVAMIGLMIPSAFASEHSTTSTPEAIKEMMEQREKFRCLTESIVHTWKDGECITKPEWYTSNQTNWSVPKAETPKHIKELVVNLGFKKAEQEIRDAHNYELQTMPITQNEFIQLSEKYQNQYNKMYFDECPRIYGAPPFRDYDHQFAYTKCQVDAGTENERIQNLLISLCCVTESQKQQLIDDANRILELDLGILEAEKAKYERENNPVEPTTSEQISTQESSQGGGCLIATAAFGSEMAPQVQFLRELRDGTVMSTQSGTAFMTGFNQFYYSFSPQIADYERENPVFKKMVKVTLTPLLTSLTLLNYVDVDTEEEMLGYGIGIILLNVGMYFVAPAVIILQIKNLIRRK